MCRTKTNTVVLTMCNVCKNQDLLWPRLSRKEKQKHNRTMEAKHKITTCRQLTLWLWRSQKSQVMVTCLYLGGQLFLSGHLTPAIGSQRKIRSLFVTDLLDKLDLLSLGPFCLCYLLGYDCLVVQNDEISNKPPTFYFWMNQQYFDQLGRARHSVQHTAWQLDRVTKKCEAECEEGSLRWVVATLFLIWPVSHVTAQQVLGTNMAAGVDQVTLLSQGSSWLMWLTREARCVGPGGRPGCPATSTATTARHAIIRPPPHILLELWNSWWNRESGHKSMGESCAVTTTTLGIFK